MDPDHFNHRQARLSTGWTYHYVDEKPANNGDQTVTLLCIHGFPDLWYGWRHQIKPWVQRGYRVVVPDMLGYGKTDMPTETSAYSTKNLCNDLAALLDHIGVTKAVVVGHDWGAFIGARFALWHPDRLLSLAILSVPYIPPRTQYVSLEQIAKLFQPFGYQLYLASEESAAEIEAHLPTLFYSLYRTSDARINAILRDGRLREVLLNAPITEGCLLNEKEITYYLSNYERGMIGPLSYYRTTQIRFGEELAASLPSKPRITVPVIFIGGTDDKICPPNTIESQGALIDKLTVVTLQGKAHWLMLEAPEIVTDEILFWLKGLGMVPGNRQQCCL
ncbi:Alpha/Beta hydrolase protein [Pisolithus thermaeus]|nr:Alpha/Beta hydrolase protein [Pisolithus croceorrhizus]KAI6166337.1 Alpha/Beta hydrolase protein [Pisolithus thermaeus]